MSKKQIIKQLNSIREYCSIHDCKDEVQALDIAIKNIRRKNILEAFIVFLFSCLFWGGFIIMINLIY